MAHELGFDRSVAAPAAPSRARARRDRGRHRPSSRGDVRLLALPATAIVAGSASSSRASLKVSFAALGAFRRGRRGSGARPWRFASCGPPARLRCRSQSRVAADVFAQHAARLRTRSTASRRCRGTRGRGSRGRACRCSPAAAPPAARASRCRGRWSARRAPARWPAAKRDARAAGGCARRPRAPTPSRARARALKRKSPR